MLIGGIIFFISGSRFKENAIPVTGVITRIETSRDSDGDTSHSVFVTYEVNGTTYSNIHLSEYSSSMYEGKSIELYCDPYDPAKVSTTLGYIIASGVLLLLGIIFSCIGIIPAIISMIKKNLHKNVQANGRRIYGVVDSIDYDTNLSVNGRNPFIVYCTYTDEFAGVTYRFKSDHVWTDPYPILQPGSSIEIFVMPNDFSKYYVNVEGALAGKIYDYT